MCKEMIGEERLQHSRNLHFHITIVYCSILERDIVIGLLQRLQSWFPKEVFFFFFLARKPF